MTLLCFNALFKPSLKLTNGKEERGFFSGKLRSSGCLFTLLIALVAISAPTPSLGQTALKKSYGKYLSSNPSPYFCATSTAEKGFANRLWEDARGSFSGKCLLALGVGAGASMLAHTQDRAVQSYFQQNHPLKGAESYGDILGQGYTHLAIDLGFYCWGKLGNNERALRVSQALLEGLLINTLATQGLKYTIRRKRPAGDARNSLPSGHTSNSFLTATVISGMYDWNWKVALPLYLTASFVGVSRLEGDAHWLSDVVFGAVLGTVIGTATVNNYKKDNTRGLQVAPMVGGNKGITLVFKW